MKPVDDVVRAARRRRAGQLAITPADRSTEGRGRTSLVTGASSGIGRAMATLLAAKGYDVIVVARRVGLLEELAEELSRTYDVVVHVLPADLGEPEAPVYIRDQLASRGQQVDFLVNNAGYALMGNFLDNEWEEQARLFRVMGYSYIELTRYLLGHMVEQQWGRIINVASIAGLMSGTPSMVLYCASKICVQRFTEGLAGEYAKRGVHATVSVPGSTDTDLFQASGLADFSETNPLFQVTMMSPMTVARQAYAASMKGRRVVVHGWPTRIWALALLHGPPAFRYGLTEWFAKLPGASEGASAPPQPRDKVRAPETQVSGA